MNIANKTVLITGANRGIGRALVEEALKRGAKRVFAGTRTKFTHVDPRVTPVLLDVTDRVQIRTVAASVNQLDVLINNAGVAVYDDLSTSDVIEQHLAVNLFGTYHMTRAFLPQLTGSRGALINNLSLLAIAPLPIIPSYSISKAAAWSMTQSFRAYLRAQHVSVHAALIGTTDTDMTRGLDVPKVPAATTARGIIEGLEKGEEDIFPDPMAQAAAEGWRSSVVKGLEQQFAGFLPPLAPNVSNSEERPSERY